MPLDDDNEDLPAQRSSKVKIKEVSAQKSIFDSLPKKPSQEDFEKKVQHIQERNIGYKQKTAELALQFKKIFEDRTLPSNKSIFAVDLEKELLGKMIRLAIEINSDPLEQEDMGSLSWITFLFKMILLQRDRINKLEYALMQINKNVELLSDLKNTKESIGVDKK